MTNIRRRLWKLIATAVVAGAVATGAYVLYLWGTYLDEVTDAGEAYGLIIGEDQRQTFDRLPAAFDNAGFDSGSAFVEVQANAEMAQGLGVLEGRSVMVRFDPGHDEFISLSMKDRWTFFNKENHQDFLRLSFCDGALCRVYRHRKHFELP